MEGLLSPGMRTPSRGRHPKTILNAEIRPAGTAAEHLPRRQEAESVHARHEFALNLRQWPRMSSKKPASPFTRPASIPTVWVSFREADVELRPLLEPIQPLIQILRADISFTELLRRLTRRGSLRAAPTAPSTAKQALDESRDIESQPKEGARRKPLRRNRRRRVALNLDRWVW